MAYDTYLEERIDRVLRDKKIEFISKKMMGGLCYMVNEKMCVGIIKEALMCRIGKETYENAVTQHGITPMDFIGRIMKGYILAHPEAIDSEAELAKWIQLALDFNPFAKKSKSKKKKK